MNSNQFNDADHNDKHRDPHRRNQVVSAESGGIAVSGNVEKSTFTTYVKNIFRGDNTSKEKQEQAVIKMISEIVSEEYIGGMLVDGLYGVAPMNLFKEMIPDAVDSPLKKYSRQSERLDRTVSKDKSIMDVFDETRNTLLILGLPGSGKTTMLLEIAREQMKRFEMDETERLPIILNLSTYSRDMGLKDWIVEQIRTYYSLPPKDIVTKLIEDDRLLLLLDALDEIKDEKCREKCVEAINQFRNEELPKIVLSSRIDEYQDLSTRLIFDSAIHLKPLTDEQIAQYFEIDGLELTTLGDAVHRSDILVDGKDDSKDLELMTPLKLDLIRRTYGNDKQSGKFKISAGGSKPLKPLLNSYVDRMFDPFPAVSGFDDYTRKQTETWLNWLATKMAQNNLRIFMPEMFQIEWLPTKRLRNIYSVLIFFVVWIPYLISGYWFYAAMLDFFYGPDTWEKYITFITENIRYLDYSYFNWLLGWPLWGITAATTVWLFLKKEYRIINPVILGTVVCTFFGYAIGVHGFSPEAGIIGGVVFGISVGLIFWSYERQYKSESAHNSMRIRTVELRTWDKKRALRGGILGAGLGLVALALVSVGVAYNNLQSFLREYAGTPISEITFRQFYVEIWFPDNLKFIFSMGIALVMSLSFAAVLVYGLLTSEFKVSKLSEPNEGIKKSGRTGLLLGLITTIVIGISFSVPALANGGDIDFGVSFGLQFGFALALLFGGFSFFQHYILRMLLGKSKVFPFSCIGFLEYCVRLKILQRVGGGYQFIHSVLQEYFEQLESKQLR